MSSVFHANNVRRYLKYMAVHGFAPESVLKDTGIEAMELDDPNALVNMPQCQKVINNMLALTDNSALGLEIGAEFDYGDIGIMGYAMASSPNVVASSRLWVKYSHSLGGTPLEVRLNEGEPPWHFTVNNLGLFGPAFVFCVDELLMVSKFIGEKITGIPVKYAQLDLSFAPPAHQQLYRKIFSCPVRFNQPQCKLAVLSPSLDAKILNHDSMVYELYLNHCGQQAESIGDSLLLSRINSILIKSRGAIPLEDEVAARLHCSTRHLRRRLQQENQSYRQIVNRFRSELAREYVRTGAMSAQEISSLLGYKENKAFLRAFKTWTGMTVTEYQANMSTRKRMQHQERHLSPRRQPGKKPSSNQGAGT